jgi:hypothetical protein
MNRREFAISECLEVLGKIAGRDERHRLDLEPVRAVEGLYVVSLKIPFIRLA